MKEQEMKDFIEEQFYKKRKDQEKKKEPEYNPVGDTYGLIRQMYPKLWGPGKVREMRTRDRLTQIRAIQEQWKREEDPQQLTMYRIREVVELVFEGNEVGIEEVGDNMYRVGIGRQVFYCDRSTVAEFLTSLREREKEYSIPLKEKNENV